MPRNSFEVPPKNTICRIRGCKSAAETYATLPNTERVALCGMHIALYRAWRNQVDDEVKKP